MKRIILLLSFFYAFLNAAEATHLMGGEITWACQGNGTYVFTMRLYRDCNGNALNTAVGLRVHNHPSLSFIAMPLVSTTDISPQCNGSGPTLSCSSSTPGNGAVQEFVFRSNPITLSGIPPPQGWVFTFDDCCRNAAINNISINPTQTGFTLRAIMYANNGQNATPCIDSSPIFLQRPTIVICGKSPFTYNHNAFDPDLDSLSYSFAGPLDWLNGTAYTATNPPALIYNNGYSVNNPFPGPSFNPQNVPASLNASTGEISFRTQTDQWTQYNLMTVIKVQSFRCGVLTAEIFREIQVIVLDCGANNAPSITAPFQNPSTGLYTSFSDTVTAGDMVNFTITATDNEYLPIGTRQSILYQASGGQFGTGYTSTTAGCNNPPCATLTPPPPASTNSGTNNVTFQWQTSCSHIANDSNCVSKSNVYTFVLVFQDDYCPAPSYRIATVSIVVKALPVIESPSLRCTAVNPNGSVTLTWVLPPDTANVFNSYHIYSSTNPNGPFTVVDSIFNYNQTTYTHSGANANSGSVYYYIRSRSGCFGKILAQPSLVVQTMYLDVPNNGTGQISGNWNVLSTPPLPSSSLVYNIYKQLPPAPWALWNTTTSLSFLDSIPWCSVDINYRVEMDDASGCTSVSNVAGGTYSNTTIPEIPALDSVSVQIAGQLAEMGWSQSPSADVLGYIVYRQQGGVWIPLDTIMGAATTYYLNPNSNAANVSESYALAAIDTCFNTSAPSAPHSTMIVQSSVNSCEGTNTLSWNAYTGWTGGASQYNIMAAENGGVFTLLGTTPGSQNSYIHTNLNTSSTYCYIIQAKVSSANLTSSSNKLCVVADVLQQVDFTYLNVATVVTENHVFVSCLIDTAADVNFYRIVRSLNPANGFDTITTLPVPSGVNMITYDDFAVETSNKSYYYRVLMIDACNNIAGISNIGRTILLKGEALPGLSNELDWNYYEEWSAGVNKYLLHRSPEPDYAAPVRVSMMPAEKHFTDDVSQEDPPTGSHCYFVEAVESFGNTYGFKDTSRSNIVCLLMEPTLFIPNAFNGYEGSNRTFGPQGVSANLVTEYEFTIYTRWGQKLFRSKNPSEGWDGTVEGVKMPVGVYVYVMKYQFIGHESRKRIGSVTLLR